MFSEAPHNRSTHVRTDLLGLGVGVWRPNKITHVLCSEPRIYSFQKEHLSLHWNQLRETAWPMIAKRKAAQCGRPGE